jgi:hypothetical protein
MPTHRFCKTSQCNGQLISYVMKRSHERADFRKEITMAQAQRRRIVRPPVQTGPVPRGFLVSLPEPSAPVSSDVEFHDPVLEL